MSKRFWQFLTFAGALVFIAGLVLTIVLINETGQVVDDSECGDAMGAVVSADVLFAACVTSDDPKVLIGVAVLLLGGAMAGIGIWRWIATAQAEGGGGSGGGGDDGGGSRGLMSSIKNLQDQAMKLQQQSMQSGTMSAGTTPPAPSPAGADPPAPDSK